MPLLSHELSEASLQELVPGGAAEDIYLEFKQEMYRGDDENRRELLRDVTSMANAAGGTILIGIRADDEGVAQEVVGVAPNQNPERIEQTVRSAVDPALLDFTVAVVPLASGREVIAIRVAESTIGPHMVTFKGLNQFWIRIGRSKGKMSQIDVVRQVLRVHSMVDQVEASWADLVTRANARYGNTPHIIMGALNRTGLCGGSSAWISQGGWSHVQEERAGVEGVRASGAAPLSAGAA